MAKEGVYRELVRAQEVKNEHAGDEPLRWEMERKDSTRSRGSQLGTDASKTNLFDGTGEAEGLLADQAPTTDITAQVVGGIRSRLFRMNSPEAWLIVIGTMGSTLQGAVVSFAFFFFFSFS
jgi:hypothetical protein